MPRQPSAWLLPPPPPPRLHVQSGWSCHPLRPRAPAPWPGHPLQASWAARTVAIFLHFAIPAPSVKPRVGDKSSAISPSRTGRKKTRPGLQNPGHVKCAGDFQEHSPRGEEPYLPAATQLHPSGPSSPRHPRRRGSLPRPEASLPPPRGKKLAATNGRPGRRLTSASRRAALPGDPDGVSVLSPPPARPPSGCRALGLYIERALAGRRVPAVRELPSAPRGGAGRVPRGAEEQSLLLSPFPPHFALPGTLKPVHAASLSLCSRPPANFRSLPRPSPVIRRGSSPAAPPRGLLRTSLPAAPTITGSRNMSTTLLSAFYDIDFLCKTEKSLANLNLNMLDKKAVGTPVAAAPSSGFTPGFLRRHSASNLHALAHPAPSPGSCSPKFPGAANGSSCGSGAAGGPASYGTLKEPSGGGGTALLNKENKFRDRSFSENGERSQHLLHLQQQQKGGGGSQINSTRYKTELCRPFEESGTCKYGEKCQFAHGFHELRSLTRHPKYKTELCRTFHTIGFCPYGPRCHFIHNAEERRPAPSGAASGDLRSFSARDALHLGFPREPRPKLHHSLSFSGFPSGHHQPPGGLESPLLLDSPTSRTPPPPSCSSASSCSSSASSCSSDLLAPGAPCAACSSASCANNAFAFGPELSSLITPLAIQTHNFAAVAAAAYYLPQPPGLAPPAQPPAPPSAPLPPSAAAPPSPPFSFQLPRRLSESPVFDAPPSPPDSLSDRDSYLSGSLSSGSLSGSESPSLDPGRRLPIFSRLSISDD
uniref:mRNA decay activator protein ZFP36 n=1 Tax=Equus asinus TaxID=9793 RepID=A0A8C4LCS3_EQUAS